MATTLVSTGIQFPDGTIQTSAGGAILTGTFSATTAVNITGIPSGYKAIQLIFQFTVGGNITMGFRYSTNNGSSYVASGYQFYGLYTQGASYGSIETDTGTSLQVVTTASAMSSSSRQNINLIFNQTDGTRTAGGNVQSSTTNLGAGSSGQIAVNFNLGTSTYINAFQILRTSGSATLTGSYTVIGIK
jgi:hypothetical protein